jgi:hypothetical protein
MPGSQKKLKADSDSAREHAGAFTNNVPGGTFFVKEERRAQDGFFVNVALFGDAHRASTSPIHEIGGFFSTHCD